MVEQPRDDQGLLAIALDSGRTLGEKSVTAYFGLL